MVRVVGCAMMFAKTRGRMTQMMAMMSRLVRREVRKVEEMMMRGVWVYLWGQRGLTFPQ